MMDSEPDRSQAWWQGHFGTREMAEAMAADIEKCVTLKHHRLRTEVTRDREGGWNVWVWE